MVCLKRSLLVTLLIASFPALSSAAPLLQLDIAGGVYDPVSQTITATSNIFTLSAILTPKSTDSALKIAERLGQTYYVSAALTPSPGTSGATAGSFSINGVTTQATANMTYGVPPIERLSSLQGADPGDMPGHGIYPTFFTQVAFQFSASSTATTYNSAVNTGGLTPNSGGQSFFVNFAIDTSLLDPAYQLHFDLYDAFVAKCGMGCLDVDTEHWAPFTNDAQSRQAIPEPSNSLLMSMGVFLAAGLGFRRALSH
jgi:hypothetical protein